MTVRTKKNGRDHTVPAVFTQKRQLVLAVMEAAAEHTKPTMTAPAMAKAEAEGQARAIIIGVIGIAVRRVIDRRGGRGGGAPIINPRPPLSGPAGAPPPPSLIKTPKNRVDTP